MPAPSIPAPPAVPAAPEQSSAPPAPPAAAPAAPPAGMRGTMIGMAPPLAEPPGVPANPARSFKGTMIGMAPSIAEPPAVPPPPETPPIPALPSPPQGVPPGPAPGFGSTIPLMRSPLAGATEPGGSNDPAQPGGLRKTILGVALPGIAPMRPGIAKTPSQPPAAAPAPSAPPAWQYGVPPAAAYEPPPETAPVPSRPHRIPWLAALVIVLAAGLLTAAVVVFFLYRSRGAIEARLAGDPEGRERLELVCTGCADGAKVSLGGASAAFRGGRAALALERKLPIGQNRIEVAIERSPGRSDKVELTVPVEYRVRAETA
ncbi:MAG TPA: hypothetical protein VGK73_10180, partial [Polyangiaceae bacterium]